MKIELEINGCIDCVYRGAYRGYYDDGRSYGNLYYCKKGAFGKKNERYGSYEDGLPYIPKFPPRECPYLKSDAKDLLAQDLRISPYELKDVLDKYGLELVEKSN